MPCVSPKRDIRRICLPTLAAPYARGTDHWTAVWGGYRNRLEKLEELAQCHGAEGRFFPRGRCFEVGDVARSGRVRETAAGSRKSAAESTSIGTPRGLLRDSQFPPANGAGNRGPVPPSVRRAAGRTPVGAAPAANPHDGAAFAPGGAPTRIHVGHSVVPFGDPSPRHEARGRASGPGGLHPARRQRRGNAVRRRRDSMTGEHRLRPAAAIGRIRAAKPRYSTAVS